MKPQNSLIAIILAIIFTSFTACSGGSGAEGNPLAPDPAAEQSPIEAQTAQDAGRYLWGYYEISVDPATEQFEVLPVRDVENHFNILGLLEAWPCTDCLQILSAEDLGGGVYGFDIGITHPFPNPRVTGFDVRGIAMFDGFKIFPVAGLFVSDNLLGNAELMNADGYTTLYNTLTAGSGEGGLQGYLPRSSSTETLPSAMLNGFIRYESNELGPNPRKIFTAGDSVIRTFEIAMQDGPFVFGYAVDASWAPPVVSPVTDPESDFGPDANCPEPYRLSITEKPVGQGLLDEIGATVLEIRVFDHNDAASHLAPTVECPQLFNGALTALYKNGNSESTLYQVEIHNANFASVGEYEVLVSVEDDENADAPEWLDLIAYEIVTVDVSEANHQGWSIDMGGTEHDQGNSVAADLFGNVYVAGSFEGQPSFIPGVEIYHPASNGFSDAFLAKYDASGNYKWARCFGGIGTDVANGVVCDDNGNIYVAGKFGDAVDFDPEVDGFEETANGSYDAYLARFDWAGNLIWVNTWGGDAGDEAKAVALDNQGRIYVTGSFRNQTYFGDGSPATHSHGLDDTFVVRYLEDGSYDWSVRWGGDQYDSGTGIDVSNNGSVFVTGYFQSWVGGDPVDFDPHSNFDWHTSHGGADIFLVKLNMAGGLEWANTMGSWTLDAGMDVAANQLGDVFVVGYIGDSCDFNPGDGNYFLSYGGGMSDGFLARYDENGEIAWGRSIGGTGIDAAWGVDLTFLGSPFVTGYFSNEVDFQYGPELDAHSSNGGTDCFMTAYHSTSTYYWTRTWGGSENDIAYDISMGTLSTPYITGFFNGTADMDPGSGSDSHTSHGNRDVFLSKFLVNGEWSY